MPPSERVTDIINSHLKSLCEDFVFFLESEKEYVQYLGKGKSKQTENLCKSCVF